jgi:DHA2 family multidrug resistance protein
VLVAPALGPTLGGYLTQNLDWRFVFFVNLPVGIIGVLHSTLWRATSWPRSRRPS